MPDGQYKFAVDNVKYAVPWPQGSAPSDDELAQIVTSIRQTPAHVESRYFANQPTLPAGITDADIAKYRQTYLKDEDTGRPKQLLDQIANLPLDQREAALPPNLSAVGRATLLRAAYEQNATIPISGRIARTLATSRLGITPEAAKQEGVAPAVAQAESQAKTRRAQAREQAYAAREGSTDLSQNRQVNAAPLPTMQEALSAPFSAINAAVGSAIAGGYQPSMLQGLAERMAPGAGAEYEKVPGFYASAARTAGGFVEPGSLAMLGLLGPIARGLSPAGNAALAGTLLGPQVVGAVQKIASGHPGEGLGELTGLGAGLAGFGLVHGAEGIKLKVELKNFLKSGDLTPDMAAKLEAIHQLKPGELAQFPDIARELADRVVNPKKYVKIDAQLAQDVQNQQVQAAIDQATQGVGNASERIAALQTPAQEVSNAVPIPGTAPEVPPALSGGENLPAGSPGVRPGVEGTELAGTQPAAVAGAPTVAAETPAAGPAPGQAGVTSTPKGTQVPFRYEVVDASDLTPSHQDNGALTPGYDQNMQPRDLSRPAEQAKIERIAQRLDLARVTDAPTTADGAPLVGPDFHVESGNGRTLGILRAIAKYPDKYAQYVADLKAKSADLGIDIAQVERLKNPVLVRVNEMRFHSPESRANFAREAGESLVQEMSAPEKATSDARALHASDALLRYQPQSDLSSAANQEFVSRFMAQVPESQHSAFQDAEGKLSQGGKERILDAILGAAYDDPRTVERLVDSTNEEIKSVGNAMRGAANALAVLKQAIKAKTVHPLDLSSDLVDAANRYLHIKRKGSTVADELANPEMFGPTLSDEAQALLQFFEIRNKAGKVTTRSATSIGDLLKYYVDHAFKQGNPQQTGGPVPGTKLEVLQAAMRRVAGEESSGNLFQEPTESRQPNLQPNGEARRPASARAEAGAKRTELAAAAGPEQPAASSTPKSETAKGGEKLTRNWQAGMNRAEVTFASETQRDLYDIGSNSQPETGRNPKPKPASFDAIVSRAESATGLKGDALTRRANDVYQDVKAQMKGVKDGETRQVTEKPVEKLSALDASADTHIQNALAKLKKKGGKLGVGVDPTDIPAYIELAYGYMQKGIVSAGRMLAKLREDFEENFPDLADPDFRKIYAGAKKLYEATVQAVDREAPLVEPLPGSREEKYIGSRNVKVPGYSPEAIADLRRLYAKNKAEFDARKSQADVAAIHAAADKPGVLPDNWETADPATLLDPVKLVAMHNATNASRARLEAARARGDKPAAAAAEIELTQREAAYQAAANLWGKTGGVLKTLGIKDAYDPIPAQRVAALFQPEVRQGTNRGSKLFTLSPQGQAEVAQAMANIRARLSRTSALTPGAFVEHLPDLLTIGRAYLREIPNNFSLWLKSVQQHVDVSESQGQQIFSQIQPKKTRSVRQPTPNSQPSTTGEFTRTGSGRAVQTGLGIEPTTQGEFQPGRGKVGAQLGLEGTTPEMTGTPPESFRPGVSAPDAAAETAAADLGKPFEFVSEPAYREALKLAHERLEAIPKGETDDTKLAARDSQAQGALNDLALYHLDQISKEVAAGNLSEKSIRSQWQRRMTKDIGEWATRQVLNDVWKGLRDFAEEKAGVKSQARDILRRNMVRDLDRDQVQAFAEDLSKLDESDPKYYDKLLGLGMKYSALSKPGWANVVQSWLAFRRAGILSSPRTIVKVLTSHGIFLGAEELAKVPASITDSLIGHFLSGQRTILSPRLADIMAAVKKGFTQGIPEGIKIARIGEAAAERQGVRRIGSNPVDFAYGEIQSSNPIINNYANFVTQQHAAAYRPFKVAVVAKSIAEQARVLLENQGLTERSVEYAPRLKALIDNPTDEMSLQAIKDAEDATFLNENALSSSLTQIKQAHPAVKAAVEFLLPVQKVPTNIWLKSWEYATGAHKIFTLLSPSVRAKLATDPVFQKQFSMTFGRGALGLGVIFLGAYLEQQGLLKMEKDKSKKRLGKYLLHAGGKEAELGVLAPIGTLLSVGANLHEWETGSSTDYLGDIINLNLEQPYIRTAQQFANPFDKSGTQFAAGVAHPSIVPFSQALSDLAAQMDEKPRDTKSQQKGAAGVRERFTREMMKKTPILRSYLPSKPGEETNRLFDPLNIRKAR